MAFTTEELEAIERLEGYNGDFYDADDNPLGLAGAGYAANPDTGFVGNWDRTTTDIAVAANAVIREANAILSDTDDAKTAAEDALNDLLNTMVNGLYTTSANSVAIGTGTKTFTVDDDLANDVKFLVGMWVKAVSRADTTKWMAGTITSLATGTPDQITISVPSGATSGSGSPSDWNIIMVGQPGPVAPVAKSDYSALPALADTDTLIFFDASDSNTPKYFAYGDMKNAILDEAIAMAIALS